ncbi:MAG: AI-2E family transporter [Planctomycetes bacterium]|nr:AI-2E family transporter [Planctomycetota bacterium]
MTPSEHFSKSTWMLTLVSLAMAVAVLYLAKGVLVPLMLALLLSFLLAPICDRLERWRLGRIPAVLITAVMAFTVLGIAVWTASVQLLNLAPKLPEYQNNIHSKLDSVNDYVSKALNKARKTTLNIGQNLTQPDPEAESRGTEDRPQVVRVIPSPSSAIQVLGGMFGSLLEVFGSTGIVIILVVFFLLQRDDLRDRFIRLSGGGRVTTTTQALEDVTARVSRYLFVQLFINVTFGVLIAVGLYFIGLPNAVLWGFMATVLRFIPYIGPWIAATAPIGLSMAISTGWGAPILTAGLFVVLELFSNNVMEPWFYGKHTGVSSVAVLLAAVFWTWLWGPVGLLLATPLTVCLLVIGKHVPQLSFLDTLLGNEPVFEMKKRIYQRLLAGDQEEAAELLLKEVDTKSLVEVYDTVLLPVLAHTGAHWIRGDLDESRHEYMFQSLKELIEELSERWQALQKKESAAEAEPAISGGDGDAATAARSPTVLCLPAHDEADEIAGAMLNQLMESQVCSIEVASAAALVSERIDLVEKGKPDIVCISATPPASVMHARYLYRRFRGHFPDAKLVVGLWDAKVDLNQARIRIGCGPETHMVATLTDALEKICQLAHRSQTAGRQPLPQARNSIAMEGALA